jgi:hypothetical protein
VRRGAEPRALGDAALALVLADEQAARDGQSGPVPSAREEGRLGLVDALGDLRCRAAVPGHPGVTRAGRRQVTTSESD